MDDEDTLATPAFAHVALAIVGAVGGFFLPLVGWPLSYGVVLPLGVAFACNRAFRGLGVGILAGVASLWLVLLVALPWLFEYRYPGVD